MLMYRIQNLVIRPCQWKYVNEDESVAREANKNLQQDAFDSAPEVEQVL